MDGAPARGGGGGVGPPCINVLRFFFSPLDPNAEAVVADEAQRRRLTVAGGACVLVGGGGGPAAAGLWWAYCHSVAAEGDTAYVLCDRERGGAGPCLAPGVSLKDPAWQRVALRYAESAQDALRALLSLHELVPAPRVLVADLDWSALLPPGGSAEAARLAGLLLCALRDAARSAVLIVALGPGDGEAEALVRRWVPLALALSAAGSFQVLQVEGSSVHAKARFTVSPANVLQLHSVVG